jgi:hypothetical protein
MRRCPGVDCADVIHFAPTEAAETDAIEAVREGTIPVGER